MNNQELEGLEIVDRESPGGYNRIKYKIFDRDKLRIYINDVIQYDYLNRYINDGYIWFYPEYIDSIKQYIRAQKIKHVIELI